MINFDISNGHEQATLDIVFSTSDNVFSMCAVPVSQARRWAHEINERCRAGCPSIAPGTDASLLLQECLPALDAHSPDLAERVRIALGGIDTEPQ